MWFSVRGFRILGSARKNPKSTRKSRCSFPLRVEAMRQSMTSDCSSDGGGYVPSDDRLPTVSRAATPDGRTTWGAIDAVVATAASTAAKRHRAQHGICELVHERVIEECSVFPRVLHLGVTRTPGQPLLASVTEAA